VKRVGRRYGEQNAEQELIFDYFCEKNMLALLTDMIKVSTASLAFAWRGR
jgi:hypothetical protein